MTYKMTLYWEVNLSCPQALKNVVLAPVCVLADMITVLPLLQSEPSYGHIKLAKISANGGKSF
jgi:hypothetical protein